MSTSKRSLESERDSKTLQEQYRIKNLSNNGCLITQVVGTACLIILLANPVLNPLTAIKIVPT